VFYGSKNELAKYSGYCSRYLCKRSDQFHEKNKDKPFFTLFIFNAPHTPLQCQTSTTRNYKNIDPKALGFGQDGKPFYNESEAKQEDAREKSYAMAKTIDE